MPFGAAFLPLVHCKLQAKVLLGATLPVPKEPSIRSDRNGGAPSLQAALSKHSTLP